MENLPTTDFENLYERCLYDPKFFIESLVEITDKDRHVIPFIFNPAQEVYIQNRTNKDIILKPRQLGFSTVIMALFLHDTMFVPNTTSVIIAHTTEAAATLFDRVKFMFYSIPEVFRPHVKYSNRKELTFDKINSTFFIGSAEAKDFGRGKTIQNLHCSEAAAPAWNDDFLVGLLESVPKSGTVVLESTARGEGNLFHRFYMAAKEGKNDFRGHYFRWYEHKEYFEPLLEGEELSLNEDELHLVEKVGLRLDQIKWRRGKIAVLGNQFIQEYPEEDDEDAFLKSGSPVFDSAWLARRNKELPEQFPAEVWLGGDLFIYKIAEGGHKYVIGADCSEGDINSDFSSGVVLKVFPPPIEQVALLHGRWTPDMYSEKLWRLGNAYNKAMIVVERNNHGHAVLLNLLNGIVRQGKVKYPPYPNVFYGMDKKAGWLTSTVSKPQMIQELDKALRAEEIIVNSKVFIDEARKFVFHTGNKMSAASGSHDDTVMAMAIAIMGAVLGGDFNFGFI